ncbi:MAG: recC, partial [Xanthomonadaceae bacterium]|nr:recC [Xanthomonadaceae bacterium]
YHQGDADAVREALVVRHALQPFAPAAFGAAHEGERLAAGASVDPRRFSFDARWWPAAAEAPGSESAPVFAPAALQLPIAARGDDETVSLARLRRLLMRPHAVYLQDGLGLRLPEDEPPLLDHEPLGALDGLADYALRHAVFAAWLHARAAPDARGLHAHLLARAMVAPGADGRATVAAMLESIAPFASLACAAGFGGPVRDVPIAERCGKHVLRDVVDQVYAPGVLRVVLNRGGMHGGHAVRHGLDHLCASLAGLTLQVLAAPGKDEPPQLTALPPLARDVATDMIVSLVALRDAALRAPLLFLPKAGWRYVQVLRDKGAAAALKTACECWTGGGWNPGPPEAGAATRVALRGRDPFLNDDARSQQQFAATTQALFATLAGQAPFELDVLR